ncbi:MAG: alpha-amylase family glycosyl hydrolase, partial [Thermoflexales bacterium]|nr:alpha-amylase family glycosyl hydrolase [Thermoflexales bacterium]
RRPSIETPAWFNEATLYQIFPRSFYDSNGDGVGDLNGIRQKLDYIQSLGVDTLWLNPHYPATSYHGYDVANYLDVHPELGTLEDFKALLAELKQRNMRLLVDFVANHTSLAHPFFKDAYLNPASPYTDWFLFQDAQNRTFASFFGTGYLPEWNHSNKAVRKYLIDAALFWLDLGVDGLRCDYARGVEHWFWRELRAAVKARHPHAVILGEVWDGQTAVLQQYFLDGFDALFDFPWYLAMTGGDNVNGGGGINGQTPPQMMLGALIALQRTYPRGAQVVRFPSNHDTNRVASAVQEDAGRMRLMAAASFLLPGIPIVYYGEEIGMRGAKGSGAVYDEYRREPMDWYAAEEGPGMTTWFRPPNRYNRPRDGVSVEEQERDPDSLLNFYRRLGRLRREHEALRASAFQLLDRVEGCAESCVGVWRWSASEVALVMFNFSPTPQTVRLPLDAAPRVLEGEALVLLGERAHAQQLTLAPWGVSALLWRSP